VSGQARAGAEGHLPLLHIVRGQPSDEELAALTAVLVAVASAAQPTPPAAVRSIWGDPAHALRMPLHPGPGTGVWRTSLHPR
jgi:hypothetical protein